MKGWISSDKLQELAYLHKKSGYGSYLSNLINPRNKLDNMQLEKLITNSGIFFSDVKIIIPQIFEDNRGYFYESWNKKVSIQW